MSKATPILRVAAFALSCSFLTAPLASQSGIPDGGPGSCSVSGPLVAVGGAVEPAHLFGRIPDASLLPDSGMAVIDRQAHEVQLFDRSGQLIRSLGRSGEGPGEFMDPIELEVSGHTITVWDWGSSRVTVFDLDSDSIETITIRGQTNPTGRFGLRTSGGYVFGTSTGLRGFNQPGADGLWVRRLGIVLTGPSGNDPDTILEVPDRVTGWIDRDLRYTGSPIFSPRADLAVSAGTIWTTRGDSAMVLRVDETGIDTVRWHRPLEPVRPGEVDTFRRERLASRDNPLQRRMIDQEFEKFPVSESYPAVGGLAPDTEGGVWIHSYPRPGEDTLRWIRIEDDQVVCEVDMPASFMAMEGGSTWLLGVARDDLDVQRVELWSVNPPGR